MRPKRAMGQLADRAEPEYRPTADSVGLGRADYLTLTLGPS
jgi:hypothetical protein